MPDPALARIEEEFQQTVDALRRNEVRFDEAAIDDVIRRSGAAFQFRPHTTVRITLVRGTPANATETDMQLNFCVTKHEEREPSLDEIDAGWPAATFWDRLKED